MVTALRAIMMAFGMVWLLFVVSCGYMGHVVTRAAQQSSQSSSGFGDSGRSLAEDPRSEAIREELRREIADMERDEQNRRDGVNIEDGSTRPMVDPDPSHRY